MPRFPKKSESQFEPAPEGLHLAVLTEIRDYPNEETPWGVKDRLQFRWQLEEENRQGRRHMAFMKMTNSSNEKSTLMKIVESWRGKRFASDHERETFDLDSLVGKVCQLQIVHNQGGNGRVYANVNLVAPAPKGATMEILDYGDGNDGGADDVPF